MLRIQAASLWNGNRNRATHWGGDDDYPAEFALLMALCIGFDTGSLPPTTPTMGIGGLTRSCARTGQNDSMARSHVMVGPRTYPMSQPAFSPGGGTVPVRPRLSSCQTYVAPFPSRSSCANASPNGPAAQVLCGNGNSGWPPRRPDQDREDVGVEIPFCKCPVKGRILVRVRIKSQGRYWHHYIPCAHPGCGRSCLRELSLVVVRRVPRSQMVRGIGCQIDTPA